MIYNLTGETKIVDGHKLWGTYSTEKEVFWIDKPQMLCELPKSWIGKDTIIYGCTFTHRVTIGKDCKITHTTLDCSTIIGNNSKFECCYIGNLLNGMATFSENTKLAYKDFYAIGSYGAEIEEQWEQYHVPGVSVLIGDSWCRINCSLFEYAKDADKLFNDDVWAAIIEEKDPEKKSAPKLLRQKEHIQKIIAEKLDSLNIKY